MNSHRIVVRDWLVLESHKTWHEERLPIVEDRIRSRLDGADILNDYPNLMAYVARGEARPAFKRAFAAQLAVFKAGHGS
ncbi:hypothetical protein [uncultured Marinobacter sp.]|uniref:hypothetical protein n=1 Tax=uncultured Marinobacter sp. TaxID=187379 RepID=UPI002591FC30|nr:hypothetical protein [uncultured Marinobacter sp.]